MSTSTSDMNESQLCTYVLLSNTIMNNMKNLSFCFFITADEHVFVVPSRAIKVPVDMSVWEKSEAYFVSFSFLFIFLFSIYHKIL